MPKGRMSEKRGRAGGTRRPERQGAGSSENRGNEPSPAESTGLRDGEGAGEVSGGLGEAKAEARRWLKRKFNSKYRGAEEGEGRVWSRTNRSAGRAEFSPTCLSFMG